MSTQSPVSEREGTLKYSGDLGLWVLLNWTDCWKQILNQLLVNALGCGQRGKYLKHSQEGVLQHFVYYKQ